MAAYSALCRSYCYVLAALLGTSKVQFPGSTAYNSSLLSYFTPEAASVHPSCFVTPATTADVSTIIRTLTVDGLSTPCQFEVRSGGHMWFAGAASASGGVTIDLRGLNSIAVHTNNATVSVGMGATWDAVYNVLDSYGLSVAGGRDAGVGVGGLTLGGGISYFGPRYGWACNQAVSFQVVLANGSVATASATQNADLWWGLRGGSNNFGVVTRTDFATFPQGDLWYTLTFNPLTVVAEQAATYAGMMAEQNYDENASFLTGWGYEQAEDFAVALNQLVYTEPKGNATPAFYDEVLSWPDALPTTPIVANMSTLAAIGAAAASPPQSSRFMTTTLTFIPTAAMILSAYEAFNASLASVQNITGVAWAVNMEALPPQIYARDATDNALGLGTGRNSSLAVWLLSPSWPDAAHDAQIYAAAKALAADVEARAKALGVFDPYIYLNYAAPWQDVIAGYGTASVRRLQALRARVDPSGVFTYQVPGSFKVPC